jgi:molybdenum cofactor cytidylyltransferase
MIATKPCFPPLPAIVVLAAGFSTRLGRPKALAHIHGRTLLQRTAAALARLPQYTVFAVIPPRSPLRRAALQAGWRCIENADRAQGLSSSVAHGIEHCRYHPAVLLLPVDLAHLKEKDLQRLLRRWRGNRRCIVARDQAGRAVIPLILPRRCFGLSRQLRGDAGLQPLIGLQARGTVRRVRLPSAAADIDTAADLHAARRRFTLATF